MKQLVVHLTIQIESTSALIENLITIYLTWNLAHLHRRAKFYRIIILLEAVPRSDPHGRKRPYTVNYKDLHGSLFPSIIFMVYTEKYGTFTNIYKVHNTQPELFLHIVFIALIYRNIIQKYSLISRMILQLCLNL